MEAKKKTPFGEKITLKGYYESLPMRQAPRYDFIKRVSTLCGVSEQTVRNWCLYGMKPSRSEYVKVLCTETGIKEEDLW